jgi:alkylation response protein AidB-like acyl-CoA dehydrogenase
LSDLAVALEELGRWLLPSPLFASAALAAPLLEHAGDGPAMQRWLPGIAAGELRATAASAENCALSVGGDDRLTGTVTRLVGGAGADLILVHASGRLFGIETTTPGLRVVVPGDPLDPTRPTANVHLDDVVGVPISVHARGWAVARDTARILLAAEQVGGAQRCLEMAVSYAQNRVQFGRPIGSFQAIKHLCADMYTDIACARALVYDAVTEVEHVAVSAAAAWASEAFVRAAERTMQIHGGISYTWEHDCHLYLRRARAAERLLGTVRGSYDDVAQSLRL